MRRFVFRALPANLMGLAFLVAAPTVAQNAQITYYAVNTGGVNRPDLEAHLGCASAKEVATWLGAKMLHVRELVVILPLVKNIAHTEPLRVSPSTVRLKLVSGEVLSALSPEEVSAWARDVGVSKVPQPDVLRGIEVSKGESAGFAAVFRLPKGRDTRRVEAEMTLELGSEGTLQVKSTLF